MGISETKNERPSYVNPSTLFLGLMTSGMVILVGIALYWGFIAHPV